ncbi:MAG TPA: HypC/HybG/HupF family hydrogenase formation chaperone [Candidatus Sulfotelmatobacter sp.]|jgi:hydrogenase expression/formation protein HypC|nr:HypC/HybG/HupF family hydrogenase formation chaperone [Candidatus Sulfotelmatobacter sp.]
MSGPCHDDVCVTCADELTPVVVEAILEDGRTAVGTVEGERCEIALDLVAGVRPGDIVLAHGGVALQLAEAGNLPAQVTRESAQALVDRQVLEESRDG